LKNQGGGWFLARKSIFLIYFKLKTSNKHHLNIKKKKTNLPAPKNPKHTKSNRYKISLSTQTTFSSKMMIQKYLNKTLLLKGTCCHEDWPLLSSKYD
jgi:hypothetical protein